MKLTAVAIIAAIVVGTHIGQAYAQDIETPDMKAANQRFRDRELARPADPYGYRQSDEYLKASPEKKRKIDEGQRKAQEDNAKIQRWLLEAKRFQDCLDAHRDDPYRSTNCDAYGNYLPNRLGVR
jgi:hypothetical protein